MKHNYEYVGEGRDHTGWWAVTLKRDDGRVVRMRKSVYVRLKREGRVVTNR